MSRGGKTRRVGRRKWLQAVGMAAVAGLAGCSTVQQDANNRTIDPSEKSVGGTFTWGATSEASGLSPLVATDEATNFRVGLIYDGGGTINEGVEFEPRWLAEWNISDSFDVVEYTLRDDLSFGGDWGALTAEDYLYNVENLWQADSNWATYTYYPEFFLEGEPIQYEQTGTYSIRAELPVRQPNWLHDDPLLYVLPFPRGLLAEYAPDQDLEGLRQDPAVTEAQFSGNLGPYEFDSWTRNSRMTLTRNDDYYLADTAEYENAPYFDEVVFQVFDEGSTAYSALKTGDITMTEIEANQVSQFTGRDDVEVWHSKFGPGLFWLNLNHRPNGWAPMRESRTVRQAFAHLFDKETLIDEIRAGNANPIGTFHPRWGPYYSDEEIETFETSVKEARAKLEAGTSSDYGYDGDTFVGPEGDQVELTLVYPSGFQDQETTANFVQQEWARVGITVDLVSTKFTNLLTKYAQNTNEEGTPAYNAGPEATSAEPWDMMLGIGLSHSAYAPWTAIGDALTEDGPFNLWGYVPDDYDIGPTLRDARTAASQAEATAILTDLFGFLSRDLPMLWAFNDHTIAGYRSQVGGLPGDDPVANAFVNPLDNPRGLFFESG